MNPETRLCWMPLSDKLTELRQACLLEHVAPPHWDRVENIAGAGTPDLSWSWNGVEGHIELKYRLEWPVNPLTGVRIESVTPHQRLWWRERWRAGGNIYVMVRLGEFYFLFEGDWVARHLGDATREQWLDAAVLCVSRRGLNAAEVLSKARRRP